MSTRWQTKRDTAANWTSNNPVLLNGEIGYETDTGKIKFGDGTTAWTSLDYFGGEGADSEKVKIDVGATAGYIGAASGDGVLRTGNSLSYTDGGNFITLDAVQDIRTSASPTFTGLTLSSIAAENSDVDKFLVDSSGVIKYRTGAQVLSDIDASASGHNHSGVYQPLDAELTSLAGLSYAAASFIKMTGANTFALRTIAQTKTDLSLNNVSNVATDDTAYNVTSWNANTDAATKNAIRDKVETIDTAISSNTTHRGLTSGNPHVVTPTELSLVIGTNVLAERTIGIADTDLVKIDHATVADNDYAKFTASGLEGRSYAEVLSDIGAVAVSGQTLLIFTPQSNEPPSSNFATFDTRNSHPVLDFALDEICVFSGILPRKYGGGGVTVYLHYCMTSAVADDIKLEAYLERIGDQQQDIDSDGFAAVQNSGDITVPGVSGNVDIIAVTFTDGAQMDSLAVGEGFRLKIKRIAVAGTDASGDLELRFVEIKET